jgi:hypothetical protein
MFYKWRKGRVFRTDEAAELCPAGAALGRRCKEEDRVIGLQKTPLCLNFSPTICFSRACLGNLIVFSIKWLPKKGFPHRCVANVADGERHAEHCPAFITIFHRIGRLNNLVHVRCLDLQQNGLFLSFPYVCSEPFLVKRAFSYINGAKRPFFHLCAAELEALVLEFSAVRFPCRNASFFEFSLCLSRACLGKIIVFMYKWLKTTDFRTVTERVANHLPLVEAVRPAGVRAVRWVGTLANLLHLRPRSHAHVQGIDGSRGGIRSILIPVPAPANIN